MINPKPMIFNPVELHPAGNAIVVRQNGNAITITLDQLYTFTSYLHVLGAEMRDGMRDPLEGE